ncbi:probable ubiquitin carboxyl-terminal hydrolase MINDY-4 [Caerostris extrusa]|uniref:Ubiquitin carboxyl-terminal hydrolase MINDY n=1 Tax=Caerostris extrusa TaxID=172846 RepID=A0AAV4QS13_CAEEX|nr:probable ubiquitin carboxyl-terminal hydrolase MINDY-4 [Caerostris extrusa]
MAPDILEPDGILEYNITSILHQISLQTLMPAVFTFFYSLILTRGIEKIKQEMDYPDSHLIGTDGYCSQEVINLILTGKAVPNLFDGDVELNSGGSETTLLRGISEQSKMDYYHCMNIKILAR